MPFHDLRHTSVALAIADGAHPKAIQARMRHSSITVTDFDEESISALIIH